MAILFILLQDFNILGEDFVNENNYYKEIIVQIMFLFSFSQLKEKIQKFKDKFSIKKKLIQKLTLINLLFTLLVIAHY